MTIPKIPYRFSTLATALLTVALTACGSDSDNGGGASSQSSQSSENASSSSTSASSQTSASSEASTSSEASSSSSASSEGPISIEPDFQLSLLADFPVGVAVSAASEPYTIFGNNAQPRRDVIVEHFSQLTAGNIMKMSYLHPEEDRYTFDDADELVNFAQTNGMSVHGHALVWHPDYQVPNFMNGYEGDWEAMLTDHVTTIVNHFGDTVVSWDVVNEAVDTYSSNPSDGWRHSVFYNYEPPAEGEVPPYIEVAFQAAHDAKPELDLYYNDYDNTANADRLAKTLEIADHLDDKGIIDGVGFQMHVYMGYPSLDAFRNAFQEVVDRGLKVKVTELDVAVVNPYGGGEPPPQPDYDMELATAQKVRFCEIAEVYLETVPAELRGGFTVWGLTDDESWLMNQFENATGAEYDDVWPLLFNADLSAKPALQGVADAFNGEPCSAE
ncbi:endo-1,4-beta-xylanase [Marinimicrobium agarilyticum]|uniref:endo-1,4-beta-xylanase n=1 Tax=Marinimicrobium agarilyticum TaxID=306546 RepID=UPI0003F7C1D4|nr:endo-1,4-beta-xylanase [Marinimicrobium agarilyticum]